MIRTQTGSVDAFLLPQGGLSLFPFAFDTTFDGTPFFLQHLSLLSGAVSAQQWASLGGVALRSLTRTEDKNEKAKYLGLLFAADTARQTVEDRRTWYRKNILALMRQNRQMTDQAQKMFLTVIRGVSAQESSGYYKDLFAGYIAVLE
jgi:hypothetical protein